MLAITAHDIARLVGGTLVGGATGEERVTGEARIDSRTVTEGDLFAAFEGETVDGHDFLAAAVADGAALCLVSRQTAEDIPAVLVDDVQRALSDLARAQLEQARRENPQLRVLAITGSAGKTGTCLLYTSDAADDTPCVDLGVTAPPRVPASREGHGRPAAPVHLRRRRRLSPAPNGGRTTTPRGSGAPAHWAHTRPSPGHAAGAWRLPAAS